jgi:ribonuclease Z
VLGHYSARYKEVDLLLDEALQVFPNTILGQDGMRIDI